MIQNTCTFITWIRYTEEEMGL